MRSTTDLIAVIGLATGGVFGLLGTAVADQNTRAVSWAIDAVGLIVAASLLALKYFRAKNDLVAGGFLVFAIGEGIILSGTASPLSASVPSFAAGTALWSAGLMLTCVPREFPDWARVAGVLGAALFAITAGRIFAGEQLLPTTFLLPMCAYPFLVTTFAGWIWKLLRSN